MCHRAKLWLQNATSGLIQVIFICGQSLLYIQGSYFINQQVLMNQFPTYHDLLFDPQIYALAARISDRLADFLAQFRECFSYLLKQSPEVFPTYSPIIAAGLAELAYPKTLLNGPFCSKKVQKYYQCYDCAIKKEDFTHSICQQCFKEGGHLDHHFRTFSGMAICDCGDNSSFDDRFFCHRHKGDAKIDLEVTQVHNNIFIAQMQFLLFLFFRMIPIEQQIVDQHSKKQLFANELIAKMKDFSEDSYPNQQLVAHLFDSVLPEDYPFVPESERGKSMVHIMFRCTTFQEFLKNLCSNIILQLYCVPKMREIVIIQLFQLINSATSYLSTESPLSRITFQYFRSTEQIKRILEVGRAQPLRIQFNFQDSKQKCSSFAILYYNYQIIMKAKGGQQLLALILAKMNVCDLSIVFTSKQNKIMKQLIMLMQGQHFGFLKNMMLSIFKLPNRNQLLTKIMKETYRFLRTKKKSLSFTIERTFAFAFFAYLQGCLDNLQDLQQSQILELLGEENVQEMVTNVKNILKRSFELIKLGNYLQYKKVVQNQKESKWHNKLICSVDYIYFRVLLLFLLKFELNSDASPIHQILEHYILIRSKQMTTLYEIYQETQITKTEQILNVLVSEIFILVQHILFLSESSICEVIAGQFLGFSHEEETLNIYRLLVYINPDITPKQFKKMAEEYLNNQQLIQKFIKEQFREYRQLVLNGSIPQNMYNLSFNSLYITHSTLQQITALYSLKMNNLSSPELSRVIFKKQLIVLIVSVLDKFFAGYRQFFAENEVTVTKNIISLAFQALLALYLQTRNQELANFIEKIVNQKLLYSQNNQSFTQLLELYQKYRKITENTQMDEEVDQKSRTKIDQLRKKKSEKLKALKNQQMKFLQDKKIALQVQEADKSNQVEKQECIICRQNSEGGKLNYLCHFRYSNLMSANLEEDNFPIILITTCGHTVHQECLQKVLQIEQLEIIFQLKCELCKGYANIIIPATSVFDRLEAEKYLNKLENVQERIISENIQSLNQRFSDLEPFRLRLILSIIYQIFGYGVHYSKFMCQKIMPILRVSLGVLRVSAIQSQFFDSARQYFKKSQKRSSSYTLICDNLQSLLLGSSSIKQLCNSSTKKMIVSKGTNLIPLTQQQKQKMIIAMIFDQINKFSTYFRQYSEWLGKDKFWNEPKRIAKLPHSLSQLNKLANTCPSCNKITSKMMICYLCSHLVCQQCQDKQLLHSYQHYGATAYVKIQNGEYQYCFIGKLMSEGYLYFDYIGDEPPKQGNFLREERYTLSMQKRNALIQDVLNDMIPLKVVEEARAMNSRRIECDVQ